MNRRADLIARWVFFIAGILTTVFLVGIFGMLFINGIKAFDEIGLVEFFTSPQWNPTGYEKEEYGILPLMVSTFMVTIGAMIIAVPLGVGAAAYLSEFANKKVREILKPTVEILAGIPSVAIGFLGITLVGPAIANLFGLSNGINAVNGSILLAVMALPTIISISEDAIRAIPAYYKEGGMAMGANKWVVLSTITLPASYSGIIAAIILGIGRALGETMTVLMATGNAPALTFNFFESVRTMTATIAIELGEVPNGTAHYYSLFAIGTVLFLISLIVNVLAERLAARYRHQI